MFAKFSVKKPLTVFVSVILVIILGCVSFSNMTPDLLPSINLPYAIVITSYPGATPEEVEGSISKPLEQAMASLEDISSISSVSSENVSQIILQFEESANMDSVVSNIREKINGVSGAWDDIVGTPYILKLNPDMLPVVVSAVNYEGMDNIELTSFVNDELMSQLEGISGVASVSVSGNIEESVSVILSEEKINDVNKRLKASVDKQFADAEQEIADGEAEITSGKAELSDKESELSGAKADLESGQSTLLDQTSSAQSQLIDQKITIENTKVELNNQITEAKNNRELLVSLEANLISARDNYKLIENGINEVQAGIDGLNQLKEGYDGLQILKLNLESTIAGLGDTPEELVQKDALVLQLEETNQKIAEIEAQLANYGTSYSQIDTKISELEVEKQTLEGSKIAIEESLTQAGTTINNLDNTIAETQGNIEAIDGGISQLETALEQLENGSTTVDAALAELNRQQLSGAMQISSGLSQIMVAESSITSAKAQLDSAQEQLDSAKETIEEQKETAYDSATLSITMDMVSQILTAQNFSMPVGYVEAEDGTEFMVRVGDKLEDYEEMANLLLFDTGEDAIGKIYLKDVADVFISDNSDTVYAKLNGTDGLILSFSKQSNYATATVSENINAKFKELSNKYNGIEFANLSDQGDYIEVVVNSVLQNLIYGAILSVIILLFFLKDIKPTIIIACSIPVSLLFAITLMYFSGITLNIISLSGLAIGVGMLVDNSVVVIENIHRMRSEGHSVLKAAVAGVTQVTGAIFASTLTTVCVFLPIVFVEGITRQLFVDMALTIGYALLASLIVAITLVPAMASGMLKKQKERSHKYFDIFLNAYEKIARFSLRYKWITISLSIVLLVVSTYLVLVRGFIFMPSMSSSQLTVSVTPPEDSSFTEQTELADEISTRIMDVEGVKTLGAMVGGSSGLMSMGNSGGITMYAIIEDGASDVEVGKAITEACKDLDADISTQGSMDMASMMTSMGGSGVSLTLYGNDLDALIVEAEKLGDVLKDVEGISTVESALDNSTPEMRITVDKEKAMTQGLTVAQVYINISSLITTETNSVSINENGNDVATVIYSEENQNRTLEDIKNLELSFTDNSGEKKTVLLKDIADISETKSLNSINRAEQRRYLSVSATVDSDYNITNVTADVNRALADYKSPDGINLEIGGESDTIMEAFEQLVYMMLLAIVIIYLIMVAQFQSLRLPFIVMFTIPLAFTGGFLALLVTGMELSVISMVGFVMLSGIIVNNGIVLIDYINRLRLFGMEKREAIVKGGRTRMRPILMTALTTVLGLVFMAVGTGMGAEMMQPMAVVCIGGLLYATLMTLFVVPAMYDILSKKKMEKIMIDENDRDEFEDLI